MKRYLLIEDTLDSDGVLLSYKVLDTSLSFERLNTKSQKRAIRLRNSCNETDGIGIGFSDYNITSRTVGMLDINKKIVYKVLRIQKI